MDNEYKVNIGKYLDGALQGKDLLEFETELEKDKALQEEVESQKQLFEMLKAKNEFEREKEELIPFLKRLEQNVDLNKITGNTSELEGTAFEEDPKRPSIIRRLAPLVSIAAAAAILLFIWAPWNSDLSNTQYADENFETYSLETTMDDPSKMEDNLRSGKFAYQEDKPDYAEAEKYFEAYLKGNPNTQDAEVLLYKGNCEYNLGKIEEAVNTFKQVVNKKSKYINTGYWYLALAYLKGNNTTEAIAQFRQIDKASPYYKKAEKLLRQLKD